MMGAGCGERRFVDGQGVSTAAPRKGDVAVEIPCTVRTFSEAVGVSAASIHVS